MGISSIEAIATFPNGFKITSLCVRSDASILATASKTRSMLWSPISSTLFLIPNPLAGQNCQLIPIKTFEVDVTNIVELTPGSDIFAVVAQSNPDMNIRAAIHVLSLRELDLSAPDHTVSIFPMVEFPPEARAVSGICFLSQSVMLIADSIASCIWRVDNRSTGPEVSRWISHETLCCDVESSGRLAFETLGLKYDHVRGHVYFTCPESQVFARVHVDKKTLRKASDVEIITFGLYGASELFIDTRGGFAYAADCDQRMLEKMNISPDNGGGIWPIGSSEHVMSLNGCLYPGILAATWCSDEEMGRSVYLVTRCKFLSLGMDNAANSSDPDRRSIPLFDEDNVDGSIATRLVKVTF